MNHGQSNSSMATTRTETTHRLTYSVAKAIDITTWQSVDANLSLLPDSWCLCQSHWTPTSSHNSAMEATGSACKRRWLQCCHLSMPPPRPAAYAGPACMQHACILYPGL